MQGRRRRARRRGGGRLQCGAHVLGRARRWCLGGGQERPGAPYCISRYCISRAVRRAAALRPRTCARTTRTRTNTNTNTSTNMVLASSAARMRSRPPDAVAQEPTARHDGRSLPAEQQRLCLRRRTPPPQRRRQWRRRWRRRRALRLPWCSGAWTLVAFSAGGRRVLQTCGTVGTAERRHGRLWVGWWAAHTAGGSQGGGVPANPASRPVSNPASPANPAAPAAPAFRLEPAGEGGPEPAGKQTHAAPSRAAEVPTAARREAHRAAHLPRRRRRRRAATARCRRAATAHCRGIADVQLLRAEVARRVS